MTFVSWNCSSIVIVRNDWATNEKSTHPTSITKATNCPAMIMRAISFENFMLLLCSSLSFFYNSGTFVAHFHRFFWRRVWMTDWRLLKQQKLYSAKLLNSEQYSMFWNDGQENESGNQSIDRPIVRAAKVSLYRFSFRPEKRENSSRWMLEWIAPLSVFGRRNTIFGANNWRKKMWRSPVILRCPTQQELINMISRCWMKVDVSTIEISFIKWNILSAAQFQMKIEMPFSDVHHRWIVCDGR